MSTYVDVLTDPAAFFEREGDESSAVKPAAIVFVTGLVAATGAFVTAQQWAGVDTGTEGFGMAMALFGVFWAFFEVFVPFVAWLMYAGLFFVVSALFDGEGDFGTTLKFVGWGFLPKVPAVAFSSVATYFAWQSVTIPTDASQEASIEFQRQISSHPMNLAAHVVGLAVLLWSAYIWVAAMEESRSLDRREATITVAIPVLLVVLYRLWALAGAL